LNKITKTEVMTFLRTQPVSTHFGHNKIMVKLLVAKQMKMFLLIENVCACIASTDTIRTIPGICYINKQESN
jgi:hypothetical protein